MLQMLFLNALLKPRVPILLRWLGESLMLPPRVLPIVNAAAALLLAAAAWVAAAENWSCCESS